MKIILLDCHLYLLLYDYDFVVTNIIIYEKFKVKISFEECIRFDRVLVSGREGVSFKDSIIFS